MRRSSVLYLVLLKMMILCNECYALRCDLISAELCSRTLRRMLGVDDISKLLAISVTNRTEIRGICSEFRRFENCFVPLKSSMTCSTGLLSIYTPPEYALKYMCNPQSYKELLNGAGCTQKQQLRLQNKNCFKEYLNSLTSTDGIGALSYRVREDCRSLQEFLACYHRALSKNCGHRLTQISYEILFRLHFPQYEGLCKLFERIEQDLSLTPVYGSNSKPLGKPEAICSGSSVTKFIHVPVSSLVITVCVVHVLQLFSFSVLVYM